MRNVVEASGSAGRCGASQNDLGLASSMLGVFGFAFIANARPLLRRRYVHTPLSLPRLVVGDMSVGLVKRRSELFQ